jgi:hypothetical protein
VVDAGKTLTFTPSRQIDPGLVPIFLDHLTKDLSHKSPEVTQILGVFHMQDGRPEAEVTKKMRHSGKEIMKRVSNIIIRQGRIRILLWKEGFWHGVPSARLREGLAASLWKLYIHPKTLFFPGT